MKYSIKFIENLVLEANANNSWTRKPPKWATMGRLAKSLPIRFIRTSFGGEDFVIVVNRAESELVIVTIIGRTDGLAAESATG